MHMNNDLVSTRVQIFGLGYIGLPTAVIMADAGHRVHGVDISEDVIKKLNKGSLHIYEPDLEVLLQKAIRNERFLASTEPISSEVHIIAVPTPVNHKDKSPDLSYVESACKSMARILKSGDLVVIESTIPPRTCVDLVGPLIFSLTGLNHENDYYLAHCPERVIPGKILKELRENDRIVGGTTGKASEIAYSLYSTFVKGTILKTDSVTAEMCKLMENSFRDVNIALANEFNTICYRNGVDVFEAISLANRHPRVNIHTPSIGVGGHCIPVDPWFIIHSSKNEARLLRSARSINDSRPSEVAESIFNLLNGGSIKNIALLGLTYKPDVDDIRESPAIEVVKILANKVDCELFVADPMLDSMPSELAKFKNIKWVNVSEIPPENTLVVLVDHTSFKTLKKEKRKILSIENNFSE